MQYLVDTGILLRLFDRSDPAHAPIRATLRLLRDGGHTLSTSSQNLAEFWNVSTRPATARGGHGHSIDTTERRVRFIERFGTVICESLVTYTEWRGLLLKYRIQGLAVHDARLVAVMRVSGIAHILTLNAADFARYADIT